METDKDNEAGEGIRTLRKTTDAGQNTCVEGTEDKKDFRQFDPAVEELFSNGL